MAESPSASGGPEAIVYLQSGRTFLGQVDPETDGQRFVLRSHVGSGTIQRPIQWDRIVWARIAGETISGKALHQVVLEIRQAAKRTLPATIAQGSSTARSL